MGKINKPRLNRILMALLAAVMVVCLQNFSTMAASDVPEVYAYTLEDAGNPSTAGVTINSTSVDLYVLDSWAADYISMPKKMRRTFQIKVTGAKSVSYKVISGSNVTVDSKGLVKPVGTKWYVYDTFKSTYKDPDYEVKDTSIEYEIGKSEIQVTADNKTFTVKVNVVSYADYYADKKIDEYIKKNVTGKGLTDVEKVTCAAQMAASYDYSPYSSSCVGMIVTGGGDCWASTDLIITFCRKLGFSAWSRDGSGDSGAGGGHMNAMVKVTSGACYEVDAGYDGCAPRFYDVTRRTSLYGYKYVSGGIELTQYDGEKTTGTLKVPAKIGGKTVVGIGDEFARGTNYTEVKLPDTVRYIGDSAFFLCDKLEKINLPVNLSKLGECAFGYCNSLTKIVCPSGNKYFSVKSGVIYNKDKTKLISAPAVKTISIPNTVKTIAAASFWYNENLISVIVPSSVKTIERGAFGGCINMAGIYFKGNCPKISGGTNKAYGAFYEVSAEVYYNPKKTGWKKAPKKKYDSTELTWKTWTGRITGINKCTVSLSKTKCAYTGKNVTPKVTVKYKDKILKRGRDYTLTFSNNQKIGTASVTVTGCGAYSGTIKKKFRIFVRSGDSYNIDGYIYEIDKASTDGTGTVILNGCTEETGRNLVIKNSVKIGGRSFNVTSIGISAFWGCTGLQKVVIGSNVKRIEAWAFHGCTNLKNIDIKSKKLSFIGNGAFEKCRRLSSMKIRSLKLTDEKVGYNAFNGIGSKCKFEVPSAKIKEYKKIIMSYGAGKKVRVVGLR